jgi:hypothetical protein
MRLADFGQRAGDILVAALAAMALTVWLHRVMDYQARATADDFAQKLFRSVIKYNAECNPPAYPTKRGPI